MLFRQLVDDDLGCASYLVGCEQAGEALVVDPPLAVERIVDESVRHGVRLVAVLETHTHADHVSGHGRLALERGLPVRVHGAAGAEFPHEPLVDGETIAVGSTAVTVVHTPGHRPEHCAFAVADRTRSDEPWLVLTGDSLFVGDAARPDLAVDAREGAAGLHESLRRLLELPDGVEVYPGHVAGSLCGAAMSAKASTTIGFERRFNPMLSLDTVEDFVAASAASPAVPRPPNLERIVALNRGPFVGAPAPLRPSNSLLQGVVLDVRSPDEFAAGHVPGAVNVPLRSSGFGTRAGFALDFDEPVVLHAASRDDAELAARQLHAVGLLEIAGYLEDPPATERLAPVELDELERLLAADAVVVLDVREKAERDEGYIPGSRHLPYRLVRELAADVDGDRPVVAVCESGARATIAASLLVRAGVDARAVIHGGLAAWRERGNDVVHFRRCGS